MKNGPQCYGIPLSHICRIITDAANGSPWIAATVVLGHLRRDIPPETATRLYQHWGNHAQTAKRRQDPAELQMRLGGQAVAFRCLSHAKKYGLLESRGPVGGRREYKLTPKGRTLMKGSQPWTP